MLKRQELANLLRNHGYSVHDCGGDFFAINEEMPPCSIPDGAHNKELGLHDEHNL